MSWRNGQIVNFLHVHFQMISSFKHLAARFTRVRHEPALVLVPHVPQQRALEVKNARANGALELCAVGRLAHGVNGICVCDSLEAGWGCVAQGRAKGRGGVARGRGPVPTSHTTL